MDFQVHFWLFNRGQVVLLAETRSPRQAEGSTMRIAVQLLDLLLVLGGIEVVVDWRCLKREDGRCLLDSWPHTCNAIFQFCI